LSGVEGEIGMNGKAERCDKLIELIRTGGRGVKDYFTVNELAEHFRVSSKTIYRRLWAKGIPAFKVGQQWRIAKKDLMWLRR